ncbi:MAG TPA: serpin family protein [Sphingomicrobium sp.]|nr:serpin family protein [Sphingomicrobium sp.]
MAVSVLAFFALLLAQPAPQPEAAEPKAQVFAEEDYRPDPNEEPVPARLDADGQAVVEGLNQFGFELYDRLRSQDGDLAVSPASVSTAFGLAHAAAKGRTADEIAATLHYPVVGDFQASFGGLLRTMDLHRNGRTLTVNNAIWLQEGMPIRAGYLQLVEHNYGAGIQRVDYNADPEAARLRINAWVESKTNDKIKNLLLPGNVSRDTRSYLVNTIYFKADWADPFNKDDTKKEQFTLASGDKIGRDLMHQQGNFALAEERGLKLISMPYRGGETEMLIFLPDKANGLAAFERSFDDAVLERLEGKLNRGTVKVTLPKFKIEKRFELVDTLKQLGMVTPFSSQADFSGIADVSGASAERASLAIGDVVHQVFVEVEEKGTEAAAATAIGIIITSARMGKPREFRADHPFLFLIRDRRTKAILFLGRFTGESSN